MKRLIDKDEFDRAEEVVGLIDEGLDIEESTRPEEDNILLNAIAGTLRQWLSIKESLDFNDTDVVDLGTKDWNYSSDGFFYATITDMKLQAKAVSSLYIQVTGIPAQNLNNMEMLTGVSNPIIYIKNTSYNDPVLFKVVMKGVLLAYEKA